MGEGDWETGLRHSIVVQEGVCQTKYGKMCVFVVNCDLRGVEPDPQG